MKKLLILLLPFIVFAQNIAKTIPKELTEKLCNQLAYNLNRCDNGSTLTYYKHKNLTNGDLLLFVYLDEQVEKLYDIAEGSTAILVSKEAQWFPTTADNMLHEYIQSIHQDPYANIWLRTHWEVEGVYPVFYYSKDGKKWQQIQLPANRNVDCCFEYAEEPIFLDESITLTFSGENTKSWRASYESATSQTPLWKPVSKVPKNAIKERVDKRWKVTKSNNKITFLNTHNKKKFFLPLKQKTLHDLYKIQVGAYLKQSSALTVQTSLKNIPYYPQLIKGKKYTRLFIGEFYTAQKAKAVLENLQKIYPDNKNIQNAFVMKSKPD